ncbi:hypothetical protein BJ997_003693 [Cryobacterium roopkundense]|uniref:Uncharacterized protein n=1 Tax=Cryobacterium roopkundense TaxID=1001240 RepID=A0A7W9A024_9MICO|nr:hypothetical protein [Cryobacterium roopkundense]
MKVREFTHPESIAVRHQKALADRNFWVSPGRDGTGSVVELVETGDDLHHPRSHTPAQTRGALPSPNPPTAPSR